MIMTDEIAREDIPAEQVCPTCSKPKPLTEAFFAKDKRNKYGFKYECRECQQKTIPETRVCSSCGKPKPLNEEFFTPDPRYLYGFRKQCKDCQAEYQAGRHKADPAKATKRRRKWYQENREHGQEYQRERYGKMSEGYKIAREQGLIE